VTTDADRVFARDALAGEVALVTGASRGIGAAIAAALAGAGATVIGTATSEPGATAIGQRLAAAGGRGVVLDVTDAARCEALIDEIGTTHGRLSILVNNAGITRDALAMRMKDADWDAVLATNLSAVFRLSRAVLRGMMKARQGRIVNVTSVVGASGNAGQANYAAAKAGVAGMSRALAREIGSRGVTVNCIAPGFIDTDMTRSLGAAQTQALLGQIPLGRLGAADEVAAAVVFLASAAGAYVNGATLHVNGGMYMA
jgi:3-oxoacyl-[acyl-carrier protein] reductase